MFTTYYDRNRFSRGSKIDVLVKSPIGPVFVIPAKAGIQLFQWVLDSGFHRSDDSWTFYEFIKIVAPSLNVSIRNN